MNITSSFFKTAPITIVAFLAILFSSCKKDHAKTDCKLTGIQITTLGNVTNTELYYDGAGRIVNIEQNGFAPNSLSLSYKDNSVIILQTGVLKDSLTLNPSGYLINDRLFASKTVWLNWQYQLNEKNETIKFSLTNSQSTKIIEAPYTYVNGNLVQQETTTYLYDTSQPAKQGDYLSISNILGYGIKKMPSKNLVTAMVSGSDTTHFKYAYDADGRITELNVVNKNNPALNQYKYSYDCNQ